VEFVTDMRLFLSYRRGDSAGHTGRLSDSLVARLGPDSVFHDVDTVAAGTDFVAGLDAALDHCDAVLAVIGPHWATATGADGSQRLRDPEDYVHRELVSALRRDIPIVPVLVGGASLPTPAALPDDLQHLLRRQAVELHDVSWQRDVVGLLDSLARGRRAAPGRSRRRAAVLAAALIAVAAIGVGAVLLIRRGGSGSSSSSAPPPVCPATDGAQMAPRPILPGATYSVEGGTHLRFDVLDAHVQAIDTGHWLVLVHTRMTNNTNDAEYHGDWLYDSIAVDGTPYPVTCYSITAGGEVVPPALNSEAVVGFNVNKDPNGALTLVFGDKHDLPIADAVA
jgi:hypothetical protein